MDPAAKRGERGRRSQQASVAEKLTEGEGQLAEGVGFEPTRGMVTPNGFQDRRLQPLGHPSGVHYHSIGGLAVQVVGPWRGRCKKGKTGKQKGAEPKRLRTFAAPAPQFACPTTSSALAQMAEASMPQYASSCSPVPDRGSLLAARTTSSTAERGIKSRRPRD